MDNPNAAKWLTFAVPQDTALLEVLGKITVRHGHLDYVLRMVIKTLTETSVRDALDATKRENSSMLRDRIRRLAKARLGDGPALVQLQALLERAKRATERRNDLIHKLWAKGVGGDGGHVIRDDDHSWTPVPTVEALQALELEIKGVQEELNTQRLEGFIKAALDARSHRRAQHAEDPAQG